MAQWQRGYAWEPSSQATPTIWQETDGSLPWPNIIIGGVDYGRHGISVGWNHGRDWWFDSPQPSTVYVELRGDWQPYVQAGMRAQLRADPNGPLWTGWVDQVNVQEQAGDPSSLVTTVTMGDAITKMARVEINTWESKNLAAGTLDARIRELCALAGLPSPVIRVVEGYDGTLNTIPAKTSVSGTVIDMLTVAEAEANAITEIGPDGVWWIQPRRSMPAVVPDNVIGDPMRLEGPESPYAYQKSEASAARVINSWSFGTQNFPYGSSIDAYGRKDYGVEWAGAAAFYPEATRSKLAGLMPSAGVSLRVPSRMSPLVTLKPFDYVQWDGVVWQAMSVYHQVTIGGWDMVIGLDPTAGVLGGDTPVDPKPPAVTARRTDTFLVDKDAYVVKTSGGADTGNGASENLLVGLLTDGNLCRALLQATITYQGRPITIHSAKLRVWTTSWDCMTAGSNPKVVARRVTAGWSEGSYSTKCAFSSTNKVVYPGPASTATDAVTRSMPSGNNVEVEIDVTAFARSWLAGSPNYGVMLRGASESASSNRVELHSSESGTAARRPRYVIDYTYEV